MANQMGKLVAGLVVAALSFGARAVEITPLSYAIDKSTDCGFYCYHDETGKQLIDGAYGVAGFGANLGNGNAYEWLGWLFDSPINIDFDFGFSQTVNTIKIGTTQSNINDVVLPSVDLYEKVGLAWVLVGSIVIPESSSNDNDPYSTAPHMTIDFSGLNINSQFVRVSLKNSFNGPWTFVDEVDFYGNDVAAVPEPQTLSLFLAGLGLTGLMVHRRKLAKRV